MAIVNVPEWMKVGDVLELNNKVVSTKKLKVRKYVTKDGKLEMQYKPFTTSCHHLIYAFMIENTMIYEIFGQVIKEFLTGEKLGYLDEDGQDWIYQTEGTFYSSSLYPLVSDIRPDIRGTRRNLYFRMFGMDLSHGGLDGKAYPYVKSQNSNTQFVSVLEAFLKEVWLGYVNVDNKDGIKFTDNSKIYELYSRLANMLNSRKKNSNVEYESLLHVTCMAYLADAISSDSSAMVRLLRAESHSEAGRLQKIAERVGMSVNPRTVNYLSLAKPLSELLQYVENSSLAGVQQLGIDDMNKFYDKNYGAAGANKDFVNSILSIMTNWSEATGRDLKSVPTSTSSNVTTGSGQAIRATAIDYFMAQ